MNIPDTEIPWRDLYEFVRACGNVHDPKEYGVEILNKMPMICSFDQAHAYFINGNGGVANKYLVNVERKWETLYLQYYASLYDGRYKIPHDFKFAANQLPTIKCRDWIHAEEDEFVVDFIREMGLTYSLGFGLTDPTGMVRTFITLDRKQNVPFSEKELAVLNLAYPLLNNLYQNFFTTRRTQNEDMTRVAWDGALLTEREKEVSVLLCQGLSPESISKKLHITQATAYKHITNIYKKLHVSSRQEFLVRMLRR